AVVDLNRDGKLDLAVANLEAIGQGILLGNGDGTFQRVQYAHIGNSSDVAPADLNGDGKMDLVFAGDYYGYLQVALGNGDGTSQQATSYPMPDSAATVRLADTNRDGKLDILAGGSAGMDVLL